MSHVIQCRDSISHDTDIDVVSTEATAFWKNSYHELSKFDNSNNTIVSMAIQIYV